MTRRWNLGGVFENNDPHPGRHGFTTDDYWSLVRGFKPGTADAIQLYEVERDCLGTYGVERPEDLSQQQLDSACRRLEMLHGWIDLDEHAGEDVHW